MFPALPVYLLCIIAVVVSLAVSLYSVKKIIFITQKRQLYDIPDNIRKIHGEQIPSLGGIGIFVGFLATAPFFVTNGFSGWNYLLISAVILFFTGIYDDVANMRPSKKLLAQLIAAAITVYFADIRLTSLYGICGIGVLPYWVSLGLTTFLCTFFINVFNFIDGIDGLACMTAMLYTLVLGGIFALNGFTASACVAFCLLGATAGLLYYNYAPARIYMGDTGSMLLGFMVFILSLMLVNTYDNKNGGSGYYISFGGSAAVYFIVALLFPPIFDAIRVFIMRAMKGISPLKADRRHLHYYLLDAGLTHAQAAWCLTGINAATIIIACLLRTQSPALLIPCIILPSVATVIIAQRLRTERTGQ